MIEVELARGVVARFSERSEGDQRPGARAGGAGLRGVLAPVPVSFPKQVHGGDVRLVGREGAASAEPADGLVTTERGVAIGVLVADCAPVVLAAEGVVGVVHAGWRGLAKGVLGTAVDLVTGLAGRAPAAVVGPCAGPECYEFGEEALAALEAGLGVPLASRSTRGAASLDLPGGVEALLRRAGVVDLERVGSCTICDERWFSHRRGDTERQAVAAWLA